MPKITGIHVLVLTTLDNDADVLPAIEQGTTGYLLKDTPCADLHRAVRAAPAVRRCCPPPWPAW
ncbi:hypothetical protein [Streptosporangium sp. NPDC002607]